MIDFDAYKKKQSIENQYELMFRFIMWINAQTEVVFRATATMIEQVVVYNVRYTLKYVYIYILYIYIILIYV